MKKIKDLFQDWNSRRTIQVIFGIIMVLSYLNNPEPIFLFGALFFTIQAIFNIGCAGGSCTTNSVNPNAPLIKTEKYIAKDKQK